jgi:hypothetical protein
VAIPTPTPLPTGVKSPFTNIRVWNLSPRESAPLRIECKSPPGLGVLNEQARQDELMGYLTLEPDSYTFSISDAAGKEVGSARINARKAEFYTIICRPSADEPGKIAVSVQNDTYPLPDNAPVQFRIFNAVPDCKAIVAVDKAVPPTDVSGGTDKLLSDLPASTTSIHLVLQAPGLTSYDLDLPIDPTFGRHGTVVIYRDAYKRVTARMFYEGYSKSDIQAAY